MTFQIESDTEIHHGEIAPPIKPEETVFVTLEFHVQATDPLEAIDRVARSLTELGSAVISPAVIHINCGTEYSRARR